jgi:methylmalonyl-CoA/ethylmalonyl-CoA epimerase
VILSLAHTAVCVSDIEAAVRWYSETLGLEVLAPPFRMEGEPIERDMGELVPAPVVVMGAILGLEPGDNVLELIEYPELASTPDPSGGRYPVTRPGLTHVGLVCDDLRRTRDDLESKGVEFLTSDIADIAGLRTTWFCDPWGTIFILLEKRDPERPYWRQPWR